MATELPEASVGCKAIVALEGARYSPNLRKWLRKQARDRTLRGLPELYLSADGVKFLGWLDKEDGWFAGSRLMGILVEGSRALVYAHPPASQWVKIGGFWKRYAAEGRCAIDPDHAVGFREEGGPRWSVTGDRRECLWCGKAVQTIHRWSETVERTAWRNE